MALVLTGIVNGMRPVVGTVEEGPRKGERYQFLSLEITDTRYGKVYSCQLRGEDPQYNNLVDGSKLREDFTGHKVKVTIKGQTAGVREVEDKATGNRREIIQVRSQITNVRDMGMPDDDE